MKNLPIGKMRKHLRSYGTMGKNIKILQLQYLR